MAFANLSSSTSIASVFMPTANLISSSAFKFKGSDRATYKRLPRLKIGKA